MADSFNLLDEPWIRVTRLSGEPDEVSLVTAFEEASDISGIHGEIASQDAAILRLLLAIAHRAMGGPKDVETWETYWNDPELLAVDTVAYLERFRERFDVRDPVAPFFQVAGIHAKSGKISDLESLIIDVPNGAPFFTTRIGPGLDRIDWSEAARWLVHVHAFDPSGIRSGAVGDPEVKGGKGYPIGPGWSGQIGVVMIEGNNLAETILLNTVVVGVVDSLKEKVDADKDLPPWECEPGGPAGNRDLDPTGPVSCYTWQTRRVLLHGDDSGVTGLFLGNGDKATPQNRYLYEPMTAWRYSDPQTKKFKFDVFMPYKFPKDRAMWRGLSTLVSELSETVVRMDGKKETRYKAAGVIDFYQQLLFDEIVPDDGLIPVHCVGIEYGSQEAVVVEHVDDVLKVPAKLLEKDNSRYLAIVRDAMKETDRVASSLRNLGGNLAKVQGADPDRVQAAREQAATAFYLVIDEEFPRWLASLAGEEAPDEAKWRWRERLRKTATGQCDRLVESVAPSAYAGRADGNRHIDVGISLAWFEASIRETLPARPDSQPESKKD